MDEKRFEVTGDWEGSRLDRFVRAVEPSLSFAAVQSMLRKKRVRLNGSKAKGGERLAAGDIVEMRFREEPAPAPGPPDRAGPLAGRFGGIGAGIPVLYEDDMLLVLDKPAGLPVQPGNRPELGSLLDLIELYSGRPRGVPGGEPAYPWSPVHRLDLKTTGVLVVAKTREAARVMLDSFSSGRVRKRYLVAVEGRPADSGRIGTPLRIDKGRTSRAVPSDGGRPASTRWRVIEELPGDLCLLEVEIDTGRTHQIRSHLASIGHPVAGDTEYGAARRPGDMMLHAWKISFPHPRDGRRIEVSADPPGEFPL